MTRRAPVAVRQHPRRSAMEKRGRFQWYDVHGAFHSRSSGLVRRPAHPAFRPTLPGKIPFAISRNCSSGFEAASAIHFLLLGAAVSRRLSKLSS